MTLLSKNIITFLHIMKELGIISIVLQRGSVFQEYKKTSIKKPNRIKNRANVFPDLQPGKRNKY
jgi:hypothetical protein